MHRYLREGRITMHGFLRVGPFLARLQFGFAGLLPLSARIPAL